MSRSPQKKFFGLYLLLFPVALFLACSAFYYHTNRTFLSFTDTLFKNEIVSNTLNLHYTLNSPTALGISDYPVTFGNADPKSLQASFDTLADYQESLLRFPKAWLSPKNRLTYDILELCFETQTEGSKYLLYEEPLGPSLGAQAQLPVLLAEYHFSGKKDIEDYLNLLAGLPDYFDDLLEFEQKKAKAGLFMNDTMAQGIADQCSAFLCTGSSNLLFVTFQERLKSVNGLSEKEKQDYIQRNQEAVETCVFPSYQTLSDGILALKGSGKNALGLCYYPMGKDYYCHLIKDVTGCYNSIDAIVKRIQSKLYEDVQSLRLLVKENPSLLSDAGIRRLQQGITGISDSPEKILSELQKKMSEDFPAPPKVDYDIKYVEPSLEQYSSPAFYLTAPLDDPNQNVIYINRSANYKGLDLYSTLAHEGYPGHLYQTVFSQQSGSDPVRSLLNFGGYIEGWATYIEMMSFSYADVPKETAALYRLNRSITLGLSSILDILIHYYGYDQTQTAEFLALFGFTEDQTANSFYNTILEAPGNYLKYYLGCLCFQDLQKAARKQQGDSFSMADFHKKILETGPCPFPVLYDYVLKD